ncbi:MAG: hypothetical protein IK090_02030, partial [Clostridia bacterium]|nr:hypothetical protein [Clostridia bacterium]
REIRIAVGSAYYVLDYRAEARRAILAFKFYGMVQYAAVFGRLLAPAAADWGEVDCITWAPVSAPRLARRGSRSSLLANSLATLPGRREASVNE